MLSYSVAILRFQSTNDIILINKYRYTISHGCRQLLSETYWTANIRLHLGRSQTLVRVMEMCSDSAPDTCLGLTKINMSNNDKNVCNKIYSTLLASAVSYSERGYRDSEKLNATGILHLDPGCLSRVRYVFVVKIPATTPVTIKASQCLLECELFLNVFYLGRISNTVTHWDSSGPCSGCGDGLDRLHHLFFPIFFLRSLVP